MHVCSYTVTSALGYWGLCVLTCKRKHGRHTQAKSDLWPLRWLTTLLKISFFSGCTPYQPTVNWQKSDYMALCLAGVKVASTAFTNGRPRFPWMDVARCNRVDRDRDGGRCTNHKAIMSYETLQSQTSPDVWVHKNTFAWSPTSTYELECVRLPVHRATHEDHPTPPPHLLLVLPSSLVPPLATLSSHHFPCPPLTCSPSSGPPHWPPPPQCPIISC